MISMSSLAMDPWKFPSMRSVCENCKSPVTLVPSSRKPAISSDLRKILMPAHLEADSDQAIIESMHFLVREEMQFDFSFSLTLLDRDFGPKGLFQHLDRRLHVRIHAFRSWSLTPGTFLAIARD